MSADGDGYLPEMAPEATPVAQRLASMRQDLAGARAEVAARGDAFGARRRELRHRLLNLKEDYNQLLAERLPMDLGMAFFALLVGLGIGASVFRNIKKGGKPDGNR